MKKKIASFCIIIPILFCYVVFAADPGSEEDPLVSQSYIEEVIVPQLLEYIDDKVNTAQAPTGSSEKFQVVSVDSGKTFIGVAGTELILRMGTADIIATEKGGLADTTEGVDLKNGEKMPSNHLLIIPLSDGRGFRANSDVLVMVKGEYSIE